MQVADIDVKKQSPCGHGTVICFSVYGGKDIHLADEPPAAGPEGGEAVKKNQLWVDTYCGGDVRHSIPKGPNLGSEMC